MACVDPSSLTRWPETITCDWSKTITCVTREAYPTTTVVWGNSHVVTPTALRLANTKFELLEDVRGYLVATLRASIVAAHTPHHSVTYPADWWQAFKERWFPAWAKARWPVAFKTTLISFDVLYPELAADGRFGPIIVQKVVR